jgi:hypothetical protein
MPRGDRTGPLGEGPMTGRQLGYGAGYDSPGYTKGSGWGAGRGFFGRGRGFFGRRFFYRDWSLPEPVESQSDSINQIKSDVQVLQNGLASLLERLKKFTAKDEEK